MALLAASLLPMSLTAFYNLRQSLATVKATEYHNLELLADSVAARLDQLAIDTLRVAIQVANDDDIWQFANAISIGKNQKESQALRTNAVQAIANVRSSNPDYFSLLLLDRQGKCLISTNPNNIGKSYAFRDYFQEARRGQNYISEWTVGSTTGHPGIFFSVPVVSKNSRNRKIIGVIAIKLRAEAVWRLLNGLSKKRGGSAFLVDHSGIVIAHTDRRWLYRSIVPLSPQQLRAIDPKIQFGISRIDSLNLPALGQSLGLLPSTKPLPTPNGPLGISPLPLGNSAYRSPFSGQAEIAGIAPLSTRPWKLVITEPEAIFVSPLNALAQRTAASVFLVGAIVTLCALALARSIVRPLYLLNRAAQELRLGRFSTAQVEIVSHDEVGILADTFNRMVLGLQARERELNIFGRLVSPAVREKLLEGDVELGGQTCWVSVLFSDIRGFSTLSEQLDPQDVVAFLNEYMTAMTEAIAPWGGYVNNFIGDAIVVVFGVPVPVPDPEWRAVSAALAMRDRLNRLNAERQSRGEPSIQSGIGISTGHAVAGQIGSPDRLIYTVIGDAVNVAARLESLTKDFPDHPILMNDRTALGLRDRPEISLKSLGPQHVKGRSEPVEVYAAKSIEAIATHPA
ncbi:MAG: adenylate/guanylate cyclase domain-containing protein [Oscillatoriales cyanobacterium]|nr:MAG: adenylate/guanylate cyclase domain-containing protein [Oscillatoriales cyanobacterium]